jgi:hypothetical protein
MALTLPHALEQVIRREARGEQAVEILAAAGRASDRLLRYLETLIGAPGARALLARSITLTRRQHPWLAKVPLPASSTRPEILGSADLPEPAEVMRCAVALLITFVNLLVSLIGEHMTHQILCHVWSDIAPLLQRNKESP